MVEMATKRHHSKSTKIRHDSDPLNLDVRIPVDDTILGATGAIQAEKPKLVFSANGTLVLQKPKLKVVHSNSAGNLQALDEHQKTRLSSSLEMDKPKSKMATGSDVEEHSYRSRTLSEKERERPKLKRSLSGSAMTRPPGLSEVESYMSKQDAQENSDKLERSEKPEKTDKSEKIEKSEKIPSVRARGKSRSLKLKKQLSKEHDGDHEHVKSIEKSHSVKSPESRRSKTPGPDYNDRSRKPEKGILKPSTRSKSSDSTYNENPEVPNEKAPQRDHSSSYITSFGTKHGQREEPEPDTSHFQSLTRGRPQSRLDSGEKEEESKSRDDSPSDYESAARQIRRVHKELKGKEAKSFQELKAYNMTSKEERDEIDRIQEEIAKKLAEEKLMKELQNCSYLRRGPVEELSVEDVFAKD